MTTQYSHGLLRSIKKNVQRFEFLFKSLFLFFNRWSEATRLCRFVHDDSLWAMLAAMSTHAKQLETAEVAYAAINEADKVILWQSKDFEKAVRSEFSAT